jgi:hypothetical protein
VKRLKIRVGVAALVILGASSASLWALAQTQPDGRPVGADDAAVAVEPAPGRRVIQLNAEPGRFNEPSMAINPLNPQQLVLSHQRQVTVASSADGGTSWESAQGIAPTDYAISSDSSITYDSKGTAILCLIAFDPIGTYNYLAHNAPRNGIYIRRSLDGGKTWEPGRSTVAEAAANAGIFEDKPYIVADKDPKSPYSGNLYVGWTRNSITNSMMVLSRSTDGGKTWSKATQIGDKTGSPRDDNGIVEGYSGVVTPDGTLHSVWSNVTHLTYTASRDGGLTFSRNRDIVEAGPSHFPVFNSGHANGYPKIDMYSGKSGPPRLYVSWSDTRNGDVDVFVISSPDGGKTWGRTVRVNSDPIHNGKDQLFPWLAVDPVTGDVYVMFYDRRSDPENRKFDVVIARSTDGGATFKNFLFSENSFDSMQTTIGDYTGLVAYDGRVHGIWTDVVGKDELPGSTATSAKRRATVMRVGMADFRTPRSK